MTAKSLTGYLFNRYTKLNIKTSFPQGSILAPLIFFIFFTNLTDAIESTIFKCADKDVTNWSEILTNEIIKLEKHMDENELILDMEKGKTGVGFWYGAAFYTSEEIYVQLNLLLHMWNFPSESGIWSVEKISCSPGACSVE